MLTFHHTRRSLAMVLLIGTLLSTTVGSASAASTLPTPSHTNQTEGERIDQPSQSNAPTDATTSAPPSTTALRAAPAMLYGSSTTTLFRWSSTGSSFPLYASRWSTASSSYTVSRVGDRMVSGDFNGDGVDDIATAYDYGTYFRFHVWLGGVTPQGSTGWYESTLDLDNVQGRLVTGDWDGDGRDDLALGYDYGSGTARIYRFRSTGSSFTHMAGDWVSGSGGYTLSNVGDRMAAGDVNGDGTDDIVLAYTYGTYFRFHVLLSGVTSQGSTGWYESTLNLDSVQGRFVLGKW